VKIPKKVHGECQGASCVLVKGEGVDKCQIDFDCIINPPEWLVFVTDYSTTGDFGNNDPLTFADDICNQEATSKGYSGTYAALLSTSTVDARDRILDGKYKNLDNEVIEYGKERLFDGSLENAPEKKLRRDIWTGSQFNGKGSDNCNDWTDGSYNFRGQFGVSTSKYSSWISQESTHPCDKQYNLYCFQVS